MYKSTCTFTIVLLLIAGPVFAVDQHDERPAGLRSAVVWILGLFGQNEDPDVERAAPDMRQRLGLEIIVGGEAGPPDDNPTDPHSDVTEG